MRDGYAVLNKTWAKGDKVEVTLPMEVRRVEANDNLQEDKGKVALQRGPLMYCAEWVDNGGKVSNLILPAKATLVPEHKAGLLNGVTVLNGTVPAYVIENNEKISTITQTFTAIPYYSWANRGKGEMIVWFPSEVKAIDVLSK
jgi:uncharacterized protein